MRIVNQVDFATGILFVVFGVGTAVISTTYDMGSAARMGPGYFPFWLGAVLSVLGAVTCMRAVATGAERTTLERWDIKALVIVLGSVVLFGALLESAGFLIALMALVLASCLATPLITWRGALTLALVLTVFCYLVFVYFLGLPAPLLPAFVAR